MNEEIISKVSKKLNFKDFQIKNVIKKEDGTFVVRDMAPTDNYVYYTVGDSTKTVSRVKSHG